MVRSENFKKHQVIGHPIHHVERLVEWDVDELVVLDISSGAPIFDTFREDYKYKGSKDLLEFIRQVSINCRIPLTFGGRIGCLGDVRERIQNGADKVTLNSMLAAAPELATKAARAFGSQAIVASIDYRIVDGKATVFTNRADTSLDVSPADWARRGEDLGVGEILLNSIDRDGSAKGFDLETIQTVVDSVRIPVIACGGAGHPRHFLACLEETGAAAVAAGNIFHFTENAYPNLKLFLRSKRDDVR